MRICIEKSTDKLIEMQSHATPGTLIQNAVRQGYKAEDILEKESTESEFQSILAAQPKSEISEEQKIKSLISAKIEEIALRELKTEGVIDADNKIIKTK